MPILQKKESRVIMARLLLLNKMAHSMQELSMKQGVLKMLELRVVMLILQKRV